MPPGRLLRDLPARLATAVVGLPLLGAAIWFGTPWLPLLTGLLAGVAVWEFSRLGERMGARPSLPLGMAWALALVAEGARGGVLFLPIVGAGLLLSLLWAVAGPGRRASLGVGALGGWALTVAGPLYVALPLAHGLLLRAGAMGREWLLLVVFTTLAADTSAFFVGRALGRRPLAPSISPGKTWEGALGGLLGGVGAVLALASLLGLSLALGKALLLGVAIVLGGLAGDLAESTFKRSAGVKESGRLLPGHGGVLDRLDSLVFPLIIVYYGKAWLGR